MPDEADVANDYNEMLLQASLSRRASSELRHDGVGECDVCSEWTSRLVEGECVPCRRLREDREKRWRS